jgi:hypothetical protein
MREAEGDKARHDEWERKTYDWILVYPCARYEYAGVDVQVWFGGRDDLGNYVHTAGDFQLLGVS